MGIPTTKNTTDFRARGFGARLDDLLLRLAVAPGRELSIESAPLQANRVQTSESPTEFMSDFGDVFGRDDFTGGEGLRFAHRRDRPANAAMRFWDSRNIDVSQPADRSDAGIRLLPATESIESSAETNLAAAWNGTTLYMPAGTVFRTTTNPLAVTPTFANTDPHNGEAATTVEGVAVLGTDVYAALGANGIHRDTGSGWAHWNDLAATAVWAANNRIVAAAGQSFYEVAAAGAAPSAIVTLPAGKVWTDVADAGDAILATATDGFVYSFVADNAGALILQAQTPIAGEIPQVVAAMQGVVVYGTAQTTETGTIGRLWRADLTSDGVLDNAQLLRQWGDDDVAVDRAPDAALPLRDAIYVGIRDENTETHLWRFDLATGGMTRDLTFDADAAVTGLADIDGRLFATLNGDGLYREASGVAADGYLIGPLGDFFSAEPKSWVSARIDVAPVATGEQVELYYTSDPEALSDPDSLQWIRVKRITSGSDTTETAIRNQSARFLAGMVKLSTTVATSPVVRAFSFRSYPPPGDVIVQLPVNVSDLIPSAGRRARRVPGRGERTLQALLDRQGDEAILEVFRPPLTVRGLVESVGAPVQAHTARGSVSMYSLLRFRGRKTSTGGTATAGAMGVSTLGIEAMGGLE